MIGNMIAGLTAGGASVGDFESIATVTVGAGGATDVTFSSIATTWQHLQIRVLARSNRAAADDNIGIQLNSDTGANYSHHNLRGNGTSASAGATANASLISGADITANTALSNTFSVHIIDVLDYKDTNKYTTIRTLGGYDVNGDGNIRATSGSWRNTAAVSTIKLYPATTGSWVQYTSIALYGIKG